jgi:competence protein ComGC
VCNHQVPAAPRKACTIVELLVVTGIVGCLVGLQLPAVIAARESSCCMQCKNNVHEIGVAIHQYHDASKKFPEARRVSADNITGSAPPFPCWDMSRDVLSDIDRTEYRLLSKRR